MHKKREKYLRSPLVDGTKKKYIATFNSQDSKIICYLRKGINEFTLKCFIRHQHNSTASFIRIFLTSIVGLVEEEGWVDGPHRGPGGEGSIRNPVKREPLSLGAFRADILCNKRFSSSSSTDLWRGVTTPTAPPVGAPLPLRHRHQHDASSASLRTADVTAPIE